MDLNSNNLWSGAGDTADFVVPLATAADFDNEIDYLPDVSLGTPEDYAYLNAATCPDCGSSMIRQGRCCVCPSCGFESCSI